MFWDILAVLVFAFIGLMVLGIIIQSVSFVGQVIGVAVLALIGIFAGKKDQQPFERGVQSTTFVGPDGKQYGS